MKYKIKFRHTHFPENEPRQVQKLSAGKMPRKTPVTYKGRKIHPTNCTNCDLVNDEGEVVYSGKSYCVQGDQFCKKTGRKIALTRALDNSNLNREQRRVVWTQYWDSLKPASNKAVAHHSV